MTSEERQKLIERLVEDMESWDLDTLVGWAKDRMHEILDGMTDFQLEDERAIRLEPQ